MRTGEVATLNLLCLKYACMHAAWARTFRAGREGQRRPAHAALYEGDVCWVDWAQAHAHQHLPLAGVHDCPFLHLGQRGSVRAKSPLMTLSGRAMTQESRRRQHGLVDGPVITFSPSKPLVSQRVILTALWDAVAHILLCLRCLAVW